MFYDVARVAGVAFVERTPASYAPDHVTRIRNICQSSNELETSRIVWTTVGLLERFSFVPAIRRKEKKRKGKERKAIVQFYLTRMHRALFVAARANSRVTFPSRQLRQLVRAR